MVKEQGSLGFTLRKEDESVLGHCVRALVRPPATRDGRIQPGDKIVAVNDVQMCQLTHEQAVVFLRMAGDTVKLRLYREEIQTPVAATAPADATDDAGCRTKTSLRPEAITLLSDLAQRNRKLQALSSDGDLSGASMRSTTTATTATTTTTTSPRRLKRTGCGGGGHKTSGTATSVTTTSSSSAAASDDGGGGAGAGTGSDSASFTYPRYIVTSQPTTSVGSDSEASSSISQCSFVVQPADAAAAAVVADGDFGLASLGDTDADYYEEDELWRVEDEENGDGGGGDGGAELRRCGQSSAGSLAGKCGSTPVSSRKPRFQFTGKQKYKRIRCRIEPSVEPFPVEHDVDLFRFLFRVCVCCCFGPPTHTPHIHPPTKRQPTVHPLPPNVFCCIRCLCMCVCGRVFVCVKRAGSACSVAANAYELNNLDNAALDAPLFAHSPLPFATAAGVGAATADYVSLPCGAMRLAAADGGALTQTAAFGHRQPAYLSVGAGAGVGVDVLDGGPPNMAGKRCLRGVCE